MSDHSQEVQRVDIVRLGGEDLPAQSLRFRQSAGLAVFDSGLKCLGKGHVLYVSVLHQRVGRLLMRP